MDLGTALINITVGKLKGTGTWVVLDDHSLIYAEFPTLREARAGARAAASELRREGFHFVCIDDLWEER
ncbi:hypothetical protein DLJ53_17475 [Acuticoccus sediminis]|uniref:Uncharacterized protein n=1 Tax=Acuticoccus sediminis TaxID=2184697 RepID=A0A8B2NU57_9HYPH|nr:hypothetical protein DLJ53_17475 [Acuticoccus sediminis]